MALVKCPECGRENVSDNAEACPECGYGIKVHFDKIKKTEEKRRIQEEEKQKKIVWWWRKHTSISIMPMLLKQEVLRI